MIFVLGATPQGRSTGRGAVFDGDLTCVFVTV